MKSLSRILSGNFRRLGRQQRGQAGDTIVEVMVSMAVLGLILGVSFATSRHALQTGLNASYRDQAESYAQQQVELIKQLDASKELTASYQASSFCINPADQSAVPTSNSACTPSQYTVTDSYDSSLKEYTIKAQWSSASDNAPNSVTLQYKSDNSFTDTPGSYAPPTSNINTPLSGPSLSFTSDMNGSANPTVPYGDSSLHLLWSNVILAQTCSGTSTYSGAPWLSSGPSAGSYAVGTLTTNGSYSISCTPNFGGGAPATATVNITVGAAIQPTASISASPSTIDDGQASTLNWSSTNATSCTASGSWGGTQSASGSTSTGNLSGPATDTYTLVCHGPGGDSTAASAVVNVNAPVVIPPPPPPLVFSWTFDGGSTWSSAGPQPYCTQILEPSDPNTWDDNYLCSNQNLGLCWTYYGVPGACSGGMNCISWYEPSSDPDYTWADNYLCAPPDSGYNFAWSYAGPIPGMDCVLTNEPAEPADQTWDDNYWCWSSG